MSTARHKYAFDAYKLYKIHFFLTLVCVFFFWLCNCAATCTITCFILHRHDNTNNMVAGLYKLQFKYFIDY